MKQFKVIIYFLCKQEDLVLLECYRVGRIAIFEYRHTLYFRVDIFGMCTSIYNVCTYIHLVYSVEENLEGGVDLSPPPIDRSQ